MASAPRWRRRALAAGAVVAGLLGLPLCAAAVLLWRLDSPAVKGALQRLVLTHTSLRLDYQETQLRLLRGVELRGLTLRSPPAFEAVAPDLARVASLRVEWSLAALLPGAPGGPLLRWVTVSGLSLDLVRDSDGRTSLTGLGGEAKPAPRDPTPLSALLSRTLADLPGFGGVALQDLTLTLHQRGVAGVTSHRLRVSGLCLASQDRGLRLAAARAGKGCGAEPVALALDSPRALAEARLWLDLRADRERVRLDVALRADRLEPRAVSSAAGPTPCPASSPTAAPWRDDLPCASAAWLTRLRDGTPAEPELLKIAAAARFQPREGRVTLTLDDLRLAAGAATLSGAIVVRDGSRSRLGQIEVQTLRAALDLARAAAALPPGLSPVRARRGLVRLDLARLMVPGDAAPRLASDGHLRAEAEIDDLDADLPGVLDDLRLTRARLQAQIQPDPKSHGDGLALKLSLPLHGLRLGRGAQRFAVDRLDLSASGQDVGGVIGGQASVQLGELNGPGLLLRDGRLGLRAAGLVLPGSSAPSHKSAPHLSLNGALAEVDLQRPAVHLSGRAVDLDADTRSLAAPYGGSVNLSLEDLRVTEGGHAVLAGPTRLTLRAAGVHPGPGLRRARGAADLVFTVGANRPEPDLAVTLGLRKSGEVADYDLDLRAASLAPLRARLAAVPLRWERAGLALHSSGKLEHLGAAPTLSQRSELTLRRPALTRAPGLSAETLALTLRSSGGLRRHQLDGELSAHGVHGAEAIKLPAQDPGPLRLQLAFDADVPSLHADLKVQQPVALALVLNANLDRARRAVHYDIDLSAARLSPLQPLIESLRPVRDFEVNDLTLALTSQGDVRGVVESFSPRGILRLAPRPAATFAFDGRVDLRITNLLFDDGENLVRAPRLRWQGVFSTTGEGGAPDAIARRLQAELELPTLHVELGEHNLDLRDLHDGLDATLRGEPRLGVGDIALKLRLAALQQDYAPGYRVEDLSANLRATRDREGQLRIGELKLDNKGGGTQMALSGRLDVTEERRGLSLRGTLDQDVARLWERRDDFAGRGQAALTLRVSSGDLRQFRLQAQLRAKGIDAALPRRGLRLEGFDGEVPILTDVRLDKRGLRPLRGASANLYSQLRFTDQHPLLSDRDFFSAARVVSPYFSASSVAGNLRIEQTRVDLNQFEFTLRGGRVTGQCLLDFAEDDVNAQLRLRASGITAKSGERFDGHAAVAVGVRAHSVAGRAEILRIGRRHLYELLDLSDPSRSDPAINRVRSGLSLGFPQRVSLSFQRGFATARIELGGLAGLLRIDALRGIPMGPILDRLLPQKSDGS